MTLGMGPALGRPGAASAAHASKATSTTALRFPQRWSHVRAFVIHAGPLNFVSGVKPNFTTSSLRPKGIAEPRGRFPRANVCIGHQNIFQNWNWSIFGTLLSSQ
jgi:hypothetical protein